MTDPVGVRGRPESRNEKLKKSRIGKRSFCGGKTI
jgi:hypothetical protein